MPVAAPDRVHGRTEAEKGGAEHEGVQDADDGFEEREGRNSETGVLVEQQTVEGPYGHEADETRHHPAVSRRRQAAIREYEWHADKRDDERVDERRVTDEPCGVRAGPGWGLECPEVGVGPDRDRQYQSVPAASSRGPIGLSGTRVQSRAPTIEKDAIPTT